MRGGMDPAGEFIAAMLGLGLGSMPFGRRYHAAPGKPAKKCSLPSCQTMTRHNGGYCCADHCREHRAILRTSNAPAHLPPASGGKVPPVVRKSESKEE